jgi:hypothetical protein
LSNAGKGKKMSRELIVGMLFAVSMTATAQGTKPASTTPAVPSCTMRVKAAQSAGYKAGYDEGTKEAKAQCEKDAAAPKWSPESYDIGSHINDTDLKATGGKIPIQIVVEKIPNADEYRLAAAEVITTYFPQHYVIEGGSSLIIYISGTDEIGGTVSYDIALEVFVRSGVKIGERTVPVSGTLSLDDGGGVMMNYSPEERAKLIKAKVYSILSKGDALLFSTPK